MNRYLKTFLQMSVPFGILTGVFQAFHGKGAIECLVKGTISGVFFGLVMTTFVYIAVRVYAGNRSDAFNLCKNKVITINKKPEMVIPECRNAILSVKRARIVEESDGGRLILAKVGLSWKSAGEIMKISVNETSSCTTTVEISSIPALKTTIIDYGKNDENIGAASDYLRSVFGNSFIDA